VLKQPKLNLKHFHVPGRCKLKVSTVNDFVPNAMASVRLLINVYGNDVML
jgi:hypothetical protein